jgi:hypothetical protein
MSKQNSPGLSLPRATNAQDYTTFLFISMLSVVWFSKVEHFTYCPVFNFGPRANNGDMYASIFGLR